MSDLNNPEEGTEMPSRMSVSEAASILSKSRSAKAEEATPEEVVEEETTDEVVEAGDEPPVEAETPEEEEEDEDPDLALDGPGAEEEELPQEAIEIDGELISVEELKSGYLRQSDYTKKRQAESEQVKQSMAQVEQRVNALDSILSQLPRQQEPNWHQRAAENPDWQLEKLAWDQNQQAIQNASNALVQERQLALAQAQAQTYQQLIDGSFKSEWRDPNTLNKDLERMQEFAAAIGFSQDEISQIDQPHHIKVLHLAMEAMNNRKQLKTAKKKLVKKPKVQKPGNRSRIGNAQQRNNDALRAQFDKKPTAKNAAAMFSAARRANS